MSNTLVEKYGPLYLIEAILESGEQLYKEEQKGHGPDFSHYNWSRAQRVHLNNLSQLKTITKTNETKRGNILPSHHKTSRN